ncbi:F0F1 ATP synthase subunit epsilon [Candidatus Tisiphia endosymbiont of Nemotelus uliginosus]|uniref:F0F1 ATP synthase subunit epsilon n=1 Tax=Candidatus Tisiphia endosymbiont of Nemotelus uliginosus TaxID=3077926 RepID=UPI0035C91732
MNPILRVKIITPKSILFDEEALMVTLPGTAGELGVLPGHALLIVELKEGVVQISIGNNDIKLYSNKSNDPQPESINSSTSSILKFFIYPAIAEITNTSVNILTEFASNVTSVSLTELPTKIELFKKMLEQGIEPH